VAAAARGGMRRQRRSGRGRAGGLREEAARRRGVLGDLGARGNSPWPRTGAARGVRRRRSRPSAAALRLRRCGIRAGIGLGRKRTAQGCSPCPRIERRWTGGRGATEGRSSGAARQWRPAVAGTLKVDSARGWLERARERVEEAKGEFVRLGAQRIEARRRGWPAWTLIVALSSSSARRERVEGKGMAKTSTTPCG
jgi:hypothetical protein